MNNYQKIRLSVSLTETLIQNLTPKNRVYDVRDNRVPGLYVRVEKSGTKTYRCEYKRGKHYTIGRVSKFKLSQVRERAKIILGDAERGIDFNLQKKLERQEEKSKVTLNEFLESKYKPWYKAAYPKTWKATFQVLDKNFKPILGKKPLEDITLENVESWRARAQMDKLLTRYKTSTSGMKIQYQKPISPATLNRYIERLSAVLSKAVEYKCIEKNPLIGLKKLKVPEANRIRFLSEEEYIAILKALDQREKNLRLKRRNGNRWRHARGYREKIDLFKCSFADYLKPMILLSLGSGIRFGTLVRLRWSEHVDMRDKNRIILNLTPDILKTEKGNQIPLSKNTSEILCLWYSQSYDKRNQVDWVFPGNKPNHHITSIKKSWKSLLEMAGIKNFHWHDLRHDFASQHVMSGTDLYTVMELLGHTDPKMTKKYAHLASKHKMAAMDQLEAKRIKIQKSFEYVY